MSLNNSSRSNQLSKSSPLIPMSQNLFTAKLTLTICRKTIWIILLFAIISISNASNDTSDSTSLSTVPIYNSTNLPFSKTCENNIPCILRRIPIHKNKHNFITHKHHQSSYQQVLEKENLLNENQFKKHLFRTMKFSHSKGTYESKILKLYRRLKSCKRISDHELIYYKLFQRPYVPKFDKTCLKLNDLVKNSLKPFLHLPCPIKSSNPAIISIEMLNEESKLNYNLSDRFISHTSQKSHMLSSDVAGHAYQTKTYLDENHQPNISHQDLMEIDENISKFSRIPFIRSTSQNHTQEDTKNDVSDHGIIKRSLRQWIPDVNDTIIESFLGTSNSTEQEVHVNESEEITVSPNPDMMRKRGEEGVIYIHGLFEQSGSECRDRPETGPYEFRSAQLAIQHVNEKKVIPGYELRMYHNDTKCDSGVAVDAFFHSLYRQPTMMFVLGTGSSEVTERLARVVSRWNVIQVSYGAASPALSDTKNFPMFYRTIAPDSSHNSALLAFILYHRWNTVTVLHEQGDYHALPMTKLVTDLEQVNVTVSLTKGVSERDYMEHLQEMKEQDSRIIICSISPALLRKIFCQVYELGMYGAEYAWILVGDARQFWQEISPLASTCNDHQLTSAIQGLISVGSHYGVVGNMTTVSSLTTQDLLTKTGYISDRGLSGFVTHTYDAIWTIALALRQAHHDWLEGDNDSALADFSYDDHQMARNISDILGKLHFTGVSGPVSFHNSDRVGITAFHQKQGSDFQLVAFYYPEITELDFECPGCKDVIWQGGSPPIASRIIIQRIAILDRRVFISVTALVVLGVALALTFLSFNLYYRKFKFIKLSSPNLNNFVIVGCVLVYIAVILLGIDHGTLASDDHFPIICSARAFLLSGGFSLAFGCMFIKTYRVYHIFIRTNTGIVKSKLLHDQQLLGLVSVLLLIDCVLITLWVTIDPMERQLTSLSMQVNQQERNVVYLYMREHCSSAHMAKWLGSLYIYKGLLLVVGCYMAWETRHVQVPALNDSQYIGMSVYNVVITSVIVVALANVIPAERYTLTFILVSALIFVSTTTTLCILFVPKIHTILINPEDNAIVATPGVKVECKTRRFALDEPRESLYRAEVLNRALKRELLELEEEYNRLAQKIGLTPCEVRKPKLIDNQDDDSDDGLPPWLADYKEYSSVSSEDVWYTSKPGTATTSIMASAFSAIHNMALQATEMPSTSEGVRRSNAPVDSSKFTHLNAIYPTDLRSSLPTVSSFEPRRKQIAPPKPVRGFLSDRALNKLKIPQTLRETIWDDTDCSPSLPLRNIPVLHNHLRSEPRLYSPNRHSHSNLIYASARSLNQMLSMNSKQHVGLSRNTISCDSDWMTAPLYTSTSFSTPPEDFMSFSNNGDSRRVSSEDDRNYLSCDGSNGDDHKSDENPEIIVECCVEDASMPLMEKPVSSLNSSPDHSTYCEASTGSEDTNAVSASNSVSEDTLSELSIDINKMAKHEVAQLTNDNIPEDTEALLISIPDLMMSSCDNSTPTNANIDIRGDISSASNNNSLEQVIRDNQMATLRNRVYRMEREVLLMHLDQSEAVDL